MPGEIELRELGDASRPPLAKSMLPGEKKVIQKLWAAMQFPRNIRAIEICRPPAPPTEPQLLRTIPSQLLLKEKKAMLPIEGQDADGADLKLDRDGQTLAKRLRYFYHREEAPRSIAFEDFERGKIDPDILLTRAERELCSVWAKEFEKVASTASLAYPQRAAQPAEMYIEARCDELGEGTIPLATFGGLRLDVHWTHAREPNKGGDGWDLVYRREVLVSTVDDDVDRQLVIINRRTAETEVISHFPEYLEDPEYLEEIERKDDFLLEVWKVGERIDIGTLRVDELFEPLFTCERRTHLPPLHEVLAGCVRISLAPTAYGRGYIEEDNPNGPPIRGSHIPA